MERDETPSEASSSEYLLECIDDALRNGRLMTRANLAFDILIQRHMGITRKDLPAYVEDIKRLDEEDARCGGDCDTRPCPACPAPPRTHT